MIPAKPISLFDLPYELLEHIFLFMPFHVLLYFSHTCRKLREIITHQATFQKNLKHLEIIYQTRILHCNDDYDFLEHFPKTVIDEGFDHTISPGIKERFNRIKKLRLNFEDWRKINPIIIKFCKSIERLWLFNCYEQKIKNISFLEKLVNLKELTLRGCIQIRDISPLKKLVNLKELCLGHFNQIRDISPLEKLVNLTELRLDMCTQIRDISPLAKLVKLLKLDLSGCTGVSQDDIDWIKKKLPKCIIKY
tara:strand:+ start:2050 stop:2799 length:750 start_codon:yes stop_codon:yes gene_type:complete